MYTNTTGQYNVATGHKSLYSNTTGDNNTATGYTSLYNNTTGISNTATGYQSLHDNSTGKYNTATGHLSLRNNTSADENTATGYYSLYTNSTGGRNTAAGYQSMYYNTTGDENTATGRRSLFSNTTGFSNTASGFQSLYNNTTGVNNTASGYESLKSNTTGHRNVATGLSSLHSNTTGNNNTATGYHSLLTNTTGVDNTASGRNSLYANTTGNDNTAVGKDAGQFITTGSKNTIIGRFNGNQAGLDIRTSSNNIVLSDGDGNPRVRVDGSGNVGIDVTPSNWEGTWKALQVSVGGVIAGRSDTKNLELGQNYYENGGAKYDNTSTATRLSLSGGTYKFQVATSGTAGSTISWIDAMTIDNSGNSEWGTFSATGATTGAIQYTGYSGSPARKSSINGTGNSTHNAFYNPNGEVGSIRTSASATLFNTSSDYRLKENVVPMTGSIDRLKELKPSRFNFIADATTTVDGFLAHEAHEVVPECVSGEKDAMKMEEYEVTPAVMDGETVVTEAVMGEHEVPDMQGIDQSKLVPLLVGAIQELAAENKALLVRLEALENA
jgi:hypothetical protein